ncbi:MAG: hypothetical protein CO030_02820 [Candidatus Magasanikbacteria bacterium CG_4_9_14_0_2_um_filter_42_11]|uniref:PsbP C-terminal domain-containing protein n=1 Tax=Candidatus Magasanikbacteria bacterium CG_4_9_14_0_2_um_filter_42_11 TaxID=1974643 RepID=A0A2M8F9N2_9BACT|nr:MAG: hypothetical protein COU34_02320 [Candidatus Magasanikbacteria bacterium CG10_big_fil_rev_8_21_14_0_10_43_9]PIY92105.1 MAG: hypothetical protein COY70_05020 [Candidatus Magasanikbacteria bacterium CG_4_10_14_0_8_um_filter_42_12]PJC52437.1 MAG: hypothetical protein CO030_02820 [Candidatus Magasanikbacteria bacterium CG_4_9_14_0_2_um_filter_42_11]
MDTKKTIAGVAVALALIGAGCSTPAGAPSDGDGGSATTSDAAPMKYKDFAAGITLYYPADWKQEKNPNGNGVVFLAKAGADGLQSNVGFTKQDLSAFPPVTLDQYTGIIKDDTMKRLKNANILTTDKTMLGGMEAGVMTYTAEYPEKSDKPMKIRNTYVLKDKNAYILTYTATEDTFDMYLEDAKAIEASFEFNEPIN